MALAGVDLLGLGVAVAGRAALRDVATNTSSRVRPIPAEELAEQLPGGADERDALLVLVEARSLADEHQVGVGRARAEDDLGARLREGALRAARDRVAQAASSAGSLSASMAATATASATAAAARAEGPPKLGCLLVPWAAKTENCRFAFVRPAVGAWRGLVVADELLEMRLAAHADVLVDRHRGSGTSVEDGHRGNRALRVGRQRMILRARYPRGTGARQMKTVTHDRRAAACARPLARGRRSGLVPTMGALHAGHRALFEAARAECDVGRREPVRQPGAVRRPGRPGRLSARPRADARRPRQRASTSSSRRPPASSIPHGFATWVEPGGCGNRVSRARPGPATSAASRPSA